MPTKKPGKGTPDAHLQSALLRRLRETEAKVRRLLEIAQRFEMQPAGRKAAEMDRLPGNTGMDGQM